MPKLKRLKRIQKAQKGQGSAKRQHEAKMNRSFEVWFSPGAHSGAGHGSDGRHGTVPRRDSGNNDVPVEKRQSAMTFTLRILRHHESFRSPKRSTLRYRADPDCEWHLQVPTTMAIVNQLSRFNSEGTSAGGHSAQGLSLLLSTRAEFHVIRPSCRKSMKIEGILPARYSLPSSISMVCSH